MARLAYTISVYVLIPQDDGGGTETLEEVQAGIESTCGAYLGSGYLIRTRAGIPPKVSDEL
jgi:hypothetical protein